jgi:uncharacterized membrane protein
MEQLDHFYGYFNLLLGTIMILIGFKVYKPFKGEEGEKKFQKAKTFYQLGGIALVVWGLIKIL